MCMRNGGFLIGSGIDKKHAMRNNCVYLILLKHLIHIGLFILSKNRLYEKRISFFANPWN
jgi:hypothetical protein